MSANTNISNYYKSFSGTDTLAFILMPGCTPVVIGSLTTISYSMFRNKKPVINIGRTNINGVTRGSRIFAGTMIFTLINQHWLRELQSQVDYLKDFKELKVDELPLFDIMIISANEYGNAVRMYIYGIDFTDEAQTVSVEDLFTENTFSFIARDISTFEAITNNNQATDKTPVQNNKDKFTQTHFILPSSSSNFQEVTLMEYDTNQSVLQDMNKPKPKTLKRTLYLSSQLMIGNDVAHIQTLLNDVFGNVNVNGIFDKTMQELVQKYQSMKGLKTLNGVVDDELYNMLLNDTNRVDDITSGYVVNKNGTYAYQNTDRDSNINDVLAFKEPIEILSIVSVAGKDKWYKTDQGYIPVEDVFSAHYQSSITEYPTLRQGDKSVYVTMLQTLLSDIFPNEKFVTGEMDFNTVNKIVQLQYHNGLEPNGEVNYETWLLLLSQSNGIPHTGNNMDVVFSYIPGEYTISTNNLIQELNKFQVALSSHNATNIKASVIAHFPNGNSKVKAMHHNGVTSTTMLLSTLQSAFVYDIREGGFPTYVEWIVYPYNEQPYKWKIRLDSK